MLAPEVIRRKRDGATLSAEEINFLVGGIADGGLSDAQVGALAMAFFLRGLEADERVALTRAMRDSGTVLDWDLDQPVVDKHSTGGVGDKVSLMLAPVLAACGAAVPMISGRGLGHTGGTLDKLDSIPGYQSVPATEVIKRVVRETGCAIVGQTADLAPADRRLYAVRDATGTVESIPLIVASILSKKLAEGLDALVLDVKTGSGAFMAAREDAEALARALVEVATGAGQDTVALITDMDEVLGTTAGNALEVRESVDYLTGARREPRLHEVTVALAAAVLVQAKAGARRRGRAPDGAERARRRQRGRALRRDGRGARRPERLRGEPGAADGLGHTAGRARAAGLHPERRRARRRSRRHRPGRQPPPRGRPDRLRRRAVGMSPRSAPRSGRTGRSRSSTRVATRARTRPRARCSPPSASDRSSRPSGPSCSAAYEIREAI